MPTLKLKKATADYIAEKEREKEREREKKEDTPVKQKSCTPKEKADGTGMLKGLDGEVLFEKRKRSIPPSEQVLFDWIDEHLTSKTGVHITLQRLYEYYGDVCIQNAATILEFPHFTKICQDKVGKEFGFKDSSLLKSMINERPIQPKKPKVEGETSNKLKFKDVLTEIFLELGNSRHGIRFPKLKQAVAAKYPKLRVDLRPKLLRNALERGVYWKHFAVVKGVGLAGRYRLMSDKPSESEAEEERLAAEKKVEEGKNGIENDDQKKKKVKRKKKDNIKKEGENGEGDGKDDKAETDKEGEKKEKAKKKKKRKSSKKADYRPAGSQSINHSDPQRIEDIFPLALTFGSEPKESTVPKMKKYIARYYQQIDIEQKLKPALEKGVELGIWDLLPGNKYVLKIGEFDPTLTKSMDDIICAAIIATTEPKLASAIVIKKYILEYHQKFDIENRPKLFASALERACNKNILRQVSGIGATGSYLLKLPFIPSPSLLAGDDDEDDEVGAYDDGDTDNYVAKPSKSRKNPLTSDVIIYHKDRAPPKDRSASTVSSPKKKEKLNVNRGVVKKVDKGKKGKKPKTAKPKINEKPEPDDEDIIEERDEEDIIEDHDEEVVTETVVKKSKAKTKQSPKGSRKAMPKAPRKAAPKSNKPRGKNKEEEGPEPDVPQEENSEDEPPIKPVKSSKRSRNVPKIRGSSKSSERSSSRGRSLTSYKEADSDQSNSEPEDEPDDEPVSKKSRRK